MEQKKPYRGTGPYLSLIFFCAKPAMLNFLDPELLRFGAFLVCQVSKMPTKKFFFLKEKRIDKTIKFSEYISRSRNS